MSFGRNSSGALEITDANDYYPFGMNHLKTGNAYFAQGSYKSNKYNGKELQETGMYSYGWREYMPDIGRWNGIDQLAEDYISASPYAYVMNNPINMFDPDGRATEPWQTIWDATPDGTNSYWFNNGNGGFTSYDGGPKGGTGGGGSLTSGSTVSYGGIFTMGDGVYTLPPLVLSGYGNSKNWGGAISTYNINHGILYNGIAGMQSAWNNANRPMDPMAWVRSDGGIRMMSGDMFGFSDLAGIGIERLSEDHPHLGMVLGIVGIVALKKPALAKVEGNLALGLGDDLFAFAKAKNFDTYRTFSSGFQEKKILEAMEGYEKIHFNVTGFSKYQFSKFNSANPLNYKNYTNWEMHTIFNNPSLLNKTQFYRKVGNDYEILSNFSPYGY